MLEIEQMTITDYLGMKQEISKHLNSVVVSFVGIGYYLKQIRDQKLYLQDGYKDIWEFALKEYKLDRTAASRFMSINDKFSVDGNSCKLLEQYEGFSKSTLTEMLTLPSEDYELITSDTKISDIRELKQAEQECEQDEQIEGQTSILDIMPEAVPEEDKPVVTEVGISEVIRDLFKAREMKELLNNILDSSMNEKILEWWVDDFNASGNRTFKKIPFFLFFYSFHEGIKVKNIKEGKIETHSYTDFQFMVQTAFNDVKEESDPWSSIFGAEYEEQQRVEQEALKAAEEAKKKAQEEAKRKEAEKQKAAKQKVKKIENNVQENKKDARKEEETVSNTAETVIENKEIVSETEENKEAVSDNAIMDAPEIVAGEVEDVVHEVEEAVCDVAQNEMPIIYVSHSEGRDIFIGKKNFVIWNEGLEEGARVMIKYQDKNTLRISGTECEINYVEHSERLEKGWCVYGIDWRIDEEE